MFQVVFAEDQISLIEQLQSFFGFRLFLLSGFLLLAAILLIWNTIRTAIFARRREIEVMKLVGATDWFIRIPFMLEGLLHGVIGGALASLGLGIWNSQWTRGVQGFPPNSGFASLVITNGYDKTVMLYMLIIGAVAGAIGSGHRRLPLPRRLIRSRSPDLCVTRSPLTAGRPLGFMLRSTSNDLIPNQRADFSELRCRNRNGGVSLGSIGTWQARFSTVLGWSTPRFCSTSRTTSRRSR